MGKKILILLLLCHALPALAMPGNEMRLKLDDRLGSIAARSALPPAVAENETPLSATGRAPSIARTAVKKTVRPNSFALKLSFHLSDEVRTGQAGAVERTLRQRPLPAQVAGNIEDHSVPLRLKLSSDEIDVSRIGKAGEAERLSLPASRKPLVADGQTASLPVQNQAKPLQDEAKAGKPQTTNADAGLAAAALPMQEPALPVSVALPSPTLAIANIQENRPKRLRAIAPPVAQQDDLELQNGTWAILGLALAILASWLGLRAYAKIVAGLKKAEPQRGAEPIVKETVVKEPAVRPAEASLPQAAVLPPIQVPAPSPSPVQRAPAPASFPLPEAKVLSRLAGSAQTADGLPKQERPSKAQGPAVKSMAVRKAVPLAQPRPALPQPRSPHHEAKPGALPFLPELENFLADFDPVRNGNVNEFLASRNAITPEQLIGWSTYRPVGRNFALRIVGAPALQT